jgi:molybdopterin molybdotransferase
VLHPSEARRQILERIRPASGEEPVTLADAAGRVLARAAVSDVDLPPFEKSMMDGYALRASDLAAAPRALRCLGTSRAGVSFEGPVPPGTCVEIFTGAELPRDCDAVEMVERTRREGDEVRFERAVRPAQNVSHLGEILARGREVFAPGRRLSSADLSVLASVGLDPVPVRRRPRVSILTTGDELVPPSAKPGPAQIREGNTLYLAAAATAAGALVRRHGIVPDEAGALEAAFREALEQGDVLITSGGVSVGRYDLVGAAFEAIGVEPLLHKVAIKPGKPIWFGMAGAKPVFGLPGNPVSTLLGFEVFVRPALARLAGASAEEAERLRRGVWKGARFRAADRQENLPVRLVAAEDGLDACEPVPFRGSADIVAASESDALVVVPAESEIAPGDVVLYRPLR